MAKNIKELTRAEEQIMQILWDIKRGLGRDILARFSKPQPAYSTVSTFIRILVEKGFIGYKVYGNTYEYYPLISKVKYREFQAKKLLEGYYEDSLGSLVSSFVKKREINIQEAEEIIELLQKFKKDQS